MKLFICLIVLSCSSCTSLFKQNQSDIPILSPIDRVIENQIQKISEEISL